MKKIKLFVVNSGTFGKFTTVIDELEKLCEISKVSVQRDIDGYELAEKLKGANFIVASSNPHYTNEFFEKNKDVIAILVHGIGVDNIDLNSATKNGVIITRVPGPVEREAVAMLTIALILDALRYVFQSVNKVKEGKWEERIKYIGSELTGKTIGIIGVGNIGSRVAEILSKAFNVKVIAYDPYITEDKVKDLNVELVNLDTLLQNSDIITLHTALTKETYHMLNDYTFKKIKKGAILVNTARGALIETEALLRAIDNGTLSAVALDVIENEPISKDHPILKYDNVIVTPHIGAYTFEALRGM
ncbi:MAG: NAD(P)-dependent oxidoreductase, partial [Nitrososphaeria archaeon]